MCEYVLVFKYLQAEHCACQVAWGESSNRTCFVPVLERDFSNVSCLLGLPSVVHTVVFLYKEV